MKNNKMYIDFKRKLPKPFDCNCHNFWFSEIWVDGSKDSLLDEQHISFRLVPKFWMDYLASAKTTQDVQACKILEAMNRTVSSAASADRVSNSDSSHTEKCRPMWASRMIAPKNDSKKLMTFNCLKWSVYILQVIGLPSLIRRLIGGK